MATHIGLQLSPPPSSPAPSSVYVGSILLTLSLRHPRPLTSMMKMTLGARLDLSKVMSPLLMPLLSLSLVQITLRPLSLSLIEKHLTIHLLF